jgi:hypothetical protein
MAYIKNAKSAAVRAQLNFFTGTTVEKAGARLVPPVLAAHV